MICKYDYVEPSTFMTSKSLGEMKTCAEQGCAKCLHNLHEMNPDARPSPPLGPKFHGGRKKGAPYKIVSITLYEEDLTELDAAIEYLRSKSIKNVSRSSLLRYAFHHVTLDNITEEL